MHQQPIRLTQRSTASRSGFTILRVCDATRRVLGALTPSRAPEQIIVANGILGEFAMFHVRLGFEVKVEANGAEGSIRFFLQSDPEQSLGWMELKAVGTPLKNWVLTLQGAFAAENTIKGFDLLREIGLRSPEYQELLRQECGEEAYDEFKRGLVTWERPATSQAKARKRPATSRAEAQSKKQKREDLDDLLQEFRDEIEADEAQFPCDDSASIALAIEADEAHLPRDDSASIALAFNDIDGQDVGWLSSGAKAQEFNDGSDWRAMDYAEWESDAGIALSANDNSASIAFFLEEIGSQNAE